ncbi:MAG: hypothetical protein GY841_05370 [FCB group bacterium]|nr:hypothetical protein [FCB group bacterium]
MPKDKIKDRRSELSASSLDLLEKIKDEFREQLKNGKVNVKVGEVLKIIELQNKLSSDDKARQEFLKIIESVRQKGLKNE